MAYKLFLAGVENVLQSSVPVCYLHKISRYAYLLFQELHYKLSKNSPPILVLARPANIILSSPPEVQRPVAGQCRKGQGQGHGRRQSQHGGFLRLMEQTRMGLAGYDPDEDDMRGIFMAKGPGMC